MTVSCIASPLHSYVDVAGSEKKYRTPAHVVQVFNSEQAAQFVGHSTES